MDSPDPRMDNIWRTFSLGKLQDFVALLQTLRADGVTVEEFERAVEEAKHARRRGKRQEKEFMRALAAVSPKCPHCKDVPLVLRAAAPPWPGDPALGLPPDPGDPDEGSHWVCPKCRWGKFDEHRPDVIHTELTRLARASARRKAKKQADAERKGDN